MSALTEPSAEIAHTATPEEFDDSAPCEDDSTETWWSRPGGGAEVIGVAAPLVVSSLSWTIMTFVDRILLNHWSGAAMAAAFVGSVIWWAVICLPFGLSSYTGTFVAQYQGSSQPQKIGPAVWQGAWVSLAASPFLLALIPFAESAFAWSGHSAEAVELEACYFAILCWGAPAMLLSAAWSSFYSGRGKTVVVMIVDSAYALLNVVLDWWWIFGLSVGGVEIFPAAGIAGAAWATTVSLWLKALTYLVLMLKRSHRDTFATGVWRYQSDLFHRMVHFGWPSGVQMLLDVTGFTVFVMLVGRLGSIENEASSMAFSVSMVAFMPIVGFGMAASILVGQHLGENRERIAERATWTSLQIAWTYMALISLLMVFAPWLFLSGFQSSDAIVQSDSEQRAAVVATAMVLMRFVAAYNMLDAMAIVFVSAIKGAGDTRFVLRVSLVMASLLGLFSWLSVEVFEAGLYVCWALISTWVTVLGIVMMARFLGGKWKRMRVIETP